jgi:3-dehydroquinate synthase
VKIKSKFSSIVVGRNVLNQINAEIEKISPSKVCIVTNRTIASFWLDKVAEFIDSDNNLEMIEIDDGERYKSLATAELIWKKLLEKDFTRKSLLIALGGGIVGDVAGFAASTFMRGIDFAQVPTTLLSQVDAGIGGKTGVNFKRKNTVGTFYQPKFILVDTQFLDSLPTAEFLNGLAEVVKYAVVFDENFFRFLEDNAGKVLAKDQEIIQKIVERCICMKVDVVERDEREGGLRRILNFGHTFGHPIEKMSNYKIRHGFAVSIGIMMACNVAEKMIGFEQKKEVENILKKFGLPISTRLERRKIVEETLKDKKAWYGKTVLVLPERIGKVVVREVEQKDLLEALAG